MEFKILHSLENKSGQWHTRKRIWLGSDGAVYRTILRLDTHYPQQGSASVDRWDDDSAWQEIYTIHGEPLYYDKALPNGNSQNRSLRTQKTPRDFNVIEQDLLEIVECVIEPNRIPRGRVNVS